MNFGCKASWMLGLMDAQKEGRLHGKGTLHGKGRLVEKAGFMEKASWMLGS